MARLRLRIVAGATVRRGRRASVTALLPAAVAPLLDEPPGVATELVPSKARTAEAVSGARLPGHRNLQGWSA
jgi:hypothetical protein